MEPQKIVSEKKIEPAESSNSGSGAGKPWKYLTKTVQKHLAQLTRETIDSVVPREEQKSFESSSNLIEFE